MEPLRSLTVAAALAGAALAAPGGAAEPGPAPEPWRVQFSAAVEEDGAVAPAPLAPAHGRAGSAGARREEASLDARYRLELGRASRVSLRYRGTLAREGALAPRDRQRHVPELHFRQRLAEGWTARLGWRARAEWEEGGAEALSLRERGFAELDVALGDGLGEAGLRYEHRRAGLLRKEASSASHHRVALRHEPPPLRLGEGAALDLFPKLALASSGGGDDAAALRSLGAELTARLETGAGPHLRTRLAYTRRTRDGLGSQEGRLDEDVLRVATGLEIPLREGLRLELDLGWKGVQTDRSGESASALRTRSRLELRF